MGRRPRIYFQWAICGLVVLLAIYGSKGSVLHFIEELSKRPHIFPIGRRVVIEITSRTASTDIDVRLQPSGMMAPSVHPSNGPVKIGSDVSSSPEESPMLPNIKPRAHSPTYPSKSHNVFSPSPIPSPRDSALQPSVGLPPKFEVVPPTIQGAKPPIATSTPSNHVSDEHKHPVTISPSTRGQAPAVPSAQNLSPSSRIAPVAQIRKGMPGDGERTPQSSPPVTLRNAPVSSPPERIQPNPPNMLPDITKVAPSMIGPALSPTLVAPPAIRWKSNGEPVAAPPKEISKPLSPVNRPHSKGNFPVISPAPHEAVDPSNTTHVPLVSPVPPPEKRIPDSPAPHEAKRHSNATLAPLISHPQPPEERIIHSPASSPAISIHQHISRKPGGSPLIAPSSPAPFASDPQLPPVRSPQTPASAPMLPIRQRTSREKVGNPASSSFSVSPPLSHNPGPLFSPSPLSPPEAFPKKSRRHYAPPPHIQGSSLSPTHAPFSSNAGEVAPVPSPSRMASSSSYESANSPILSPSGSASRNPSAPTPQAIPILPPPPPNLGPTHSPIISPSGSVSRNHKTPKPQPLLALPPPPPNLDCTPLICTEPLTNSPPGSPCACVLAMKVGLRLSIPLYTFFPLVSEFAQEIASGVLMKQSQVRVMGANAASEDPEKTLVLLDLVPLKYTFDHPTALLTYEKFWSKKVPLKASFLGDYDVLYVIYPGLPPPPPTAPVDTNIGDGTFGNGNNGRTIKPLGVDVRQRKKKLSGNLLAIIIVSSVMALLLIVGAAWLLLLRHGDRTRLRTPTPQTLLPPFAKSSVTGAVVLRSQHSPTSASFISSIATYKGSAKAFTLAEIERATKRFDDSRIIGEGGFGLVYQGTLEDGTRMAVKVLKRDDHQGGREFLAEIEMLSRLHHRNLVKLIGICTEDVRCLVYELIPNGSVESHLHGVDKETAPLDWSARVKIALGAARGLAYLHEDSSPRVIHRDFKSSNILLEHDYTPKVSDFGLARTALGEGNEHISTQIMGTFGYVAPEYAMTGHLLVKSDVYSYGVVLLELLTGRKPVDMLQPPGQENLVTWVRPLLTSKEGLPMIIDPALGTDYPFDSVAKVAAIASMCVQPEVAHRPFMGEVVQALKLVCNEGDEYRGSESCSQDYSSAQDTEIRISVGLDQESERMLSASDMFSTSARFTRDASGSFRQHASSGPLTTGNNRLSWQRDRSLSTGSMSEHGLLLKLGVGLEAGKEWP